MSRNKDPAVLFYTADFLADTVLWSYEELGRYIKLLCIQHLQEGVSEEDFRAVADGYNRVASKFNVGEDGLYSNKRMKEESDRRKEFCAKQRANRLGKTNEQPNQNQTATKPKPNCNPRVENENINVIRNIIEYLNSKLNTKYQYTSNYIMELVGARLEEGYVLQDFQTVIDKKYKEWNGTEFAKFLRPETLFGSKFSTYLNQIVPPLMRYGEFDPEEAWARAVERSYNKKDLG